MKAPKEVFVAVGKPYGFLHISRHESDIYNTKYIRADKAVDRDALLKWAKYEQSECHTMWANDMWQKIIDKINEL